MAHERFQVLDQDECRRLLASRQLGRIAFLESGAVTIHPVNYAFVDGMIILRTDAGGKLQAALRREQVAFEIDSIDPTDQTGWSVLVRGHAETVSDPDELSRLGAVPLVAWAPGAKPNFVRIAPGETTGRRISHRELPSTWLG